MDSLRFTVYGQRFSGEKVIGRTAIAKCLFQADALTIHTHHAGKIKGAVWAEEAIAGTADGLPTRRVIAGVEGYPRPVRGTRYRRHLYDGKSVAGGTFERGE